MALELNPGPQPKSDESVRLKREIAGLEQEVEKYKDEAQQAKVAARDAVTAVSALRKQLEPLYNSMRMLFGEIDRVTVEEIAGDAASPVSARTRDDSKWTLWRGKLPNKEWEVVEAILVHGHPMTRSQIAAAIRSNKTNVSSWCSRLVGKQLLVKQGDAWTLRENG